MSKNPASVVIVALVLCASIFVAPASAAPMCDGKPATMVGTINRDAMRGTNGDDVIVGFAGGDDINGLGGNDTICGGRGGDSLSGGRGNDSLFGARGYDSLSGDRDDDLLVSGRGAANHIGGPGNDEMRGSAARRDMLEYFTAPGPVTVDLTAGIATGDGEDRVSGMEFVFGSRFDDSITGDDRPNSLLGGPGNDTLAGGGGGVLSGPSRTTSSFGRADVYYGTEGDDTFLGSDDFDVVSYFDAPAMTVDLAEGTATGEGTDTLSNIDGIHGSRDADTIRGDGNDNAFALEAGADVVDGRQGRDLIFITDYAPSGVTVDLAAGTVTGGQGDDSLTSIEDVWGTPFSDTLKGNDDDNELQGRNGNDSLFGAGGDDTLIGGAGRDSFDGGPGFDLCEQPPERGLTNCENP